MSNFAAASSALQVFFIVNSSLLLILEDVRRFIAYIILMKYKSGVGESMHLREAGSPAAHILPTNPLSSCHMTGPQDELP